MSQVKAFSKLLLDTEPQGSALVFRHLSRPHEARGEVSNLSEGTDRHVNPQPTSI